MTDSQIKEHDVLCGRGGATNNHIGNKHFRSLVTDYQTEYLGSKKRDKAGIARQIVKQIRERGGRFLKKVDGGDDTWIEVGDKKATEKTSQALREGLDVRHKTIKTSRADTESSTAPAGSASKKRKLSPTTSSQSFAAVGNVVGSPAGANDVGIVHGLPDLREEDISQAQFAFPPPPVPTVEGDDVIEV
eukprot:scaffold48121_cov47-Attheya_sp.AAC.16